MLTLALRFLATPLCPSVVQMDYVRKIQHSAILQALDALITPHRDVLRQANVWSTLRIASNVTELELLHAQVILVFVLMALALFPKVPR